MSKGPFIDPVAYQRPDSGISFALKVIEFIPSSEMQSGNGCFNGVRLERCLSNRRDVLVARFESESETLSMQ